VTGSVAEYNIDAARMVTAKIFKMTIRVVG
jgi:hypothetical protein